MQLQGFMLMLFLLAVVPIMALSSNHEVYFIVMSLLLLILSLKDIHNWNHKAGTKDKERDEEADEDFEELLDLDVKKFGTGINIVKCLFIILFIIYCLFYLHLFVTKVCAVIAILLQLYFITYTRGSSDKPSKVLKYRYLAADLLNIAIIIFTVFNKIKGIKF